MKTHSSLILSLLAGCSVEGSKLRPPPTPGPGIAVDPATQTISLDSARVPVLESCGAGQIVRRTASGWECAAVAWDDVQSRPDVWPGTIPLDRVDSATEELGLVDGRLDELESRMNATESATELLFQRALAAEADIGDLLLRVAVLEALDCPPGYTRDTGSVFVLCKKTLVSGQIDEMVRVGDFWVDRYEASACGNTDVGNAAGDATSAIACSRSSTAPLASISWFQAAQICANAGKRLCSNAEWQMAAAGTPDPAVSRNASTSECVNSGATLRSAGGGINCRSRFGAEDMVGNVYEWVEAWAADYDGTNTRTNSTDYGSDTIHTMQIAPEAQTGGANFPSGMMRGGSSTLGTGAGVFAMSLGYGLSERMAQVGARCCRSR